MTRSVWRSLAALVLFAAGFAIANRFQLTHAVLYRAAAGDLANAADNFLMLAGQAVLLLVAVALLGGRMFVVAMVLAAASIMVNLGYGQTTAEPLDAATLAWLIGEMRQAGHAGGEFAGPLAFAAGQTVLAVVCLCLARRFLCQSGWLPVGRAWSAVALFLLILPNLAAGFVKVWPLSAERNLYAYAADIALAPPPPPRGIVEWEPNTKSAPRHIVWLIDESVAYDAFEQYIAPDLLAVAHDDFGRAVAMGNCSAPSNVALRSGVAVREAGPRLDLRTTPSIWSYAHRAGYRTILIDGQVSGRPQNLLLEPEAALIDEVRILSGSIDADRTIAQSLNAQLKGTEPTFSYAVLRGVHFQYSDHYPAGAIPADSAKALKYRTALRYSKDRFFDILLDGVDRDAVAIVYTSDHGQNLAEGALPHCSPDPVAAEFAVPLLAFLPERLSARYPEEPAAAHSASQIFPATLIWMGYGPAQVASAYDNDLDKAPARYVWFGRHVIPLEAGEGVEVHAGQRVP